MAELLTPLRRALHVLRRRRAREALRGRNPGSLLIVCHGNLCRSPFAAAVLVRALAGAGVRVESAGFVGPNRPPPPAAVAAAARRGVDLSAHRSRLVTAPLVRSAGLIVVMDAAQRRAVCDRFGRMPRDVLMLGDVDPAPAESRAIRDPVDQGPEVFDDTYARIERCVAELARALLGTAAKARAERA